MAPKRFLVARNPEPESSLPYLLSVPIDGGLELKARDRWPSTSRVYCHPLEDAWPEDAEIIEQTPVRLCRRRGPAIDLVLDRPRQFRSQIIFTQIKGRPAIFWQTQKAAKNANPGGRVPHRRVAGLQQLAGDGPGQGSFRPGQNLPLLHVEFRLGQSSLPVKMKKGRK